jgi:transposase
MGMDAIETLKLDVQEGRISVDRLVDVVVTIQRQMQATQQQLQTTQQQLQTAQQQLQTAQQRIEELEKKLGGPPTTKLAEPFSLRAEQQRQEARGQNKPQKKPKGRRGRFKTHDKIALAQRTEAVFPEGVEPEACRLSHLRPVWRLENGKAVLIAYEIYRGPKNQYGKIPGVLGRSEYGLEIVTEIAYLMNSIGLSFDKVCVLLNFFQGLRLSKSQADALMNQLSAHWEREFEALCMLLAHSLVVHADETGWSINSVWAFLSEKARLLLFGVPKDADTLKLLLDPATFAGIVISDDAAVYANFTTAQKCWAHLLCKAIRLTLQDRDNAQYRDFTDRLLAIYHEACRVQRDERLGAAGRVEKVALLTEAIFELCVARWLADQSIVQGHANDYRKLVNELMRLALEEELFNFVTAPAVEQPNGIIKPVAGTNNEAERTLRNPAQARKTGRTNKTSKGTRRQTILSSVLESLRLYLPSFTLQSVLDELKRWSQTGQSCFTKLLKKLKLTLPKNSILDQLFPIPSPSG